LSRAAQQYVLTLPRGRVTGKQRLFLLILAYHHQEYRATYWPSHESLAEEVDCDVRQVRRMVAELEDAGILSFESGLGRGRRGSYRFVEIATKEDAKEGSKEDAKEDISIPPNKVLQSQKLQVPNPPNPLFSKGGTLYRLTQRQHTRLSRYWERERNHPRDPGCGFTWEFLLRTACADLAINRDDAEHDLLLMDPELWSARLELRKAPQSA
jgi:Helix-turn-helix domain